LVKTFWGWRDRQLPDATLILTSPSGQTYVTTPGSALLFPSLCLSTGGLPAPEADPPLDYCGERTAMMPKRRRTRSQNRANRIAPNADKTTTPASPHGPIARTTPDRPRPRPTTTPAVFDEIHRSCPQLRHWPPKFTPAIGGHRLAALTRWLMLGGLRSSVGAILVLIGLVVLCNGIHAL